MVTLRLFIIRTHHSIAFCFFSTSKRARQLRTQNPSMDFVIRTRIFVPKILSLLSLHIQTSTTTKVLDVEHFFCFFLTTFNLRCRKHGTTNPSVDLWIPDKNFAMQNSCFAFSPHPCGAFVIGRTSLSLLKSTYWRNS